MARNGLIILGLIFFVVIDSLADASIVLNFRKAISETNNSSAAAAAANLTQVLYCIVLYCLIQFVLFGTSKILPLPS